MNRSHYISEAKKEKGQEVLVAGWVHDSRDLGKLKFIHVRDRTGILQVTIKKGDAPEELLALDVNKEDVVSFRGKMQDNKIAPDGVELLPTEFEILNRVEKKLPVDPTGRVPSELDTRLDYRYIDMRKEDISLIFKIKSVAINSFRNRLIGHHKFLQ